MKVKNTIMAVMNAIDTHAFSKKDLLALLMLVDGKIKMNDKDRKLATKMVVDIQSYLKYTVTIGLHDIQDALNIILKR